MSDVYAKNVAISAEDAEKIIPRAEFRVFGQGIIDIVKPAMWKAQAKLFKVRTSTGEIYFPARLTNDANVKVRKGLLDIKLKTGETPDGYEIFQPSGKFQFPVNKDDVAKILKYLKVEIPLDQEIYTLDEFRAIANEHPNLAVVDVEKKRYGFSIDGIICEYGQIYFNGAMIETTCCESEDYKGMKKAIKALKISELENINYLKAAKHVIGM